MWRTSEGLASVFTYEHSASQLAGRLSSVADLSTAGSCWRFHTQKRSNQDFVFQRGMLLPGLAFLLFSWHRVLTNSQNAIVGGIRRNLICDALSFNRALKSGVRVPIFSCGSKTG